MEKGRRHFYEATLSGLWHCQDRVEGEHGREKALAMLLQGLLRGTGQSSEYWRSPARRSMGVGNQMYCAIDGSGRGSHGSEGRKGSTASAARVRRGEMRPKMAIRFTHDPNSQNRAQLDNYCVALSISKAASALHGYMVSCALCLPKLLHLL